MDRGIHGMIPDDLKNPPVFNLRPDEVEAVNNFLKSRSVGEDGSVHVVFSKRQWRIICAVNDSFLWMVNLLTLKSVGITLIRRILNILPPKSPTPPPENSPPGDPPTSTPDIPLESDTVDQDTLDDDNDDGNEANAGDEDSKKTGEKGKRPNHHGKRGRDDLIGALKEEHQHPTLAAGDKCPQEDCNGKVYPFTRDGRPREIITFDFTPPFQPTVHTMNDLRCNMCLTIFKAVLPEALIRDGAEEGKYLYPTQAALVVLHYGLGMPLNRLDHFQSMIGERFPVATQFDILEQVLNKFSEMYPSLEKCAANAFLLQGDDMGSRVLDLNKELKERRSDKTVVCRDGVHTSILIATTHDGHFVPILKTGINHVGELLDEILHKRDKDLPAPYFVGDGSKVNSSFVIGCTSGGCWQHTRDHFLKAKQHFPDEVETIHLLIKNIFEVDRETHEMKAKTRLNYLKEKALPIVENLKKIVDDLVISKTILPKSSLGEALSYFQNQYEKLEMPFKHEGIPLHNNISEWSTYLISRIMANSKFFKTQFGALIGDKMIMLILCCYMATVNPYSYFLYCLRHYEEMKKKPEDFFPWKLRDKEGMMMPSGKQMKFWAPTPPLAEIFDD